jgi:hypothetical protein
MRIHRAGNYFEGNLNVKTTCTKFSRSLERERSNYLGKKTHLIKAAKICTRGYVRVDCPYSRTERNCTPTKTSGYRNAASGWVDKFGLGVSRVGGTKAA